MLLLLLFPLTAASHYTRGNTLVFTTNGRNTKVFTTNGVSSVPAEKLVRTQTFSPTPIRIGIDDLPQPFDSNSAVKPPNVVLVSESAHP